MRKIKHEQEFEVNKGKGKIMSSPIFRVFRVFRGDNGLVSICISRFEKKIQTTIACTWGKENSSIG